MPETDTIVASLASPVGEQGETLVQIDSRAVHIPGFLRVGGGRASLILNLDLHDTETDVEGVLVQSTGRVPIS